MKLTASGIDRAMRCVASAVLPHSASTSPWADRGTAIHAFLADLNTSMDRDAALARVPEKYREDCAAIDVSSIATLEPGSFAVEVAFAYDVEKDTARELGRNLNRAYPELGPNEIAGTVDSVGVSAAAAHVGDYKSGFGDVPPAGENWQMRFGALAAARSYGLPRAEVSIIYTRDGVPPDTATLDELDLEATALELRGLLERIRDEEKRLHEGVEPRTVEGPHCRYCPAFPYCPAKMNLARSMAQVEGWPVLTMDNAPAVLARLEAAEEVITRVRTVLEDFARATPIPLPDGEVFGPCPNPRDTIDPAKGGALLAEKYGAKLALAAIETRQELTKKRLLDALKAWMKDNPGHTVAALERQAMALLREGGAVKTTHTYPVKRHKAREELPATISAPGVPKATLEHELLPALRATLEAGK